MAKEEYTKREKTIISNIIFDLEMCSHGLNDVPTVLSAWSKHLNDPQKCEEIHQHAQLAQELYEKRGWIPDEKTKKQIETHAKIDKSTTAPELEFQGSEEPTRKLKELLETTPIIEIKERLDNIEEDIEFFWNHLKIKKKSKNEIKEEIEH